MPRFNPVSATLNNEESEKNRDRLIPFINPESSIGQAILSDGYCILPSIITIQEADIEYQRMWDFITKIQPNIHQHDEKSWMKSLDRSDIWPCAQRDMFQLHQAGWVFNDLREKIVERVFEPLFETTSLHVSKDGFTLQRPTTEELNRSPNDHFDQGSNYLGLQCIQGSVALTDQEYDDGCFSCWPKSWIFHEKLSNNKNKDFHILNNKDKNFLYSKNIKPIRVPVNKGDVILWRSDLLHCGAAPIGKRNHFRAVVYICSLPSILTPTNILSYKVKAYEELKTGCHWPNREEWFQQRGNKNNHSYSIKPYYSKPPILSKRLQQLYGLIPYEDEEIEKLKFKLKYKNQNQNDYYNNNSDIIHDHDSKISDGSGGGGKEGSIVNNNLTGASHETPPLGATHVHQIRGLGAAEDEEEKGSVSEMITQQTKSQKSKRRNRWKKKKKGTKPENLS